MTSLPSLSKFTFLILVSLFFANSVSAQATKTGAKPAKQAPKNWVVNCATRADGTLSCALRQVLTVNKTGQIFLIAQVAKPGPQDLPVMMLRLPHNVLLQKGVTFSIDSEKKRVLPIVRADSKGSYASIKLEGNLMSRMRTGKEIVLTIYSVAKGQKIKVLLPLKGFAASSKHLK